jgi:hypothetical protein
MFIHRAINVFLNAHATKNMMTFRTDSVLSFIVADSTDKCPFPFLLMFFKDKVRVICHLTHPSDELKDIRVIIEDDIGCNVGIEFPLCIPVDGFI